MAEHKDWWRGAVIYQIYPRSFKDANGDGIGDLRGITEKLDYVKSLGVDAVWISPFFKSPMKDFGYDISDYEDVDPIFGTMDDFDALMARAKELDLKILLDQIWSHTSHRHAWFEESRRDRHNSKADWYVWADPKPDGTPPNNWLSIFGGSSWEWESQRQQYYLHNFLIQQPDLNLHNQDVFNALMKSAKFWLDKGVAGFRVDALPHFLHDPLLRDNPPKDIETRHLDKQTTMANPRSYQNTIYDMDHPDLAKMLERIRDFMNQFPDSVLLGEILGGVDTIATGGEYTKGNKRLHMVYTSALLQDHIDYNYLKRILLYTDEKFSEAGHCWATGNHDLPRIHSRWNHDKDPGFDRMLLALMLSSKGSACLYQGEELGLSEADVPRDKLQDPYGIRFYPEYKGRDGCRTPMPWQKHHPQAGFTEGKTTWLPIAHDHFAKAVDQQDNNETSLLNFYRRMIPWYKNQPALRHGRFQFLQMHEPILTFIREDESQKLYVVINFSEEHQKMDLAAFPKLTLYPSPCEGAVLHDTKLELPPYSVCFLTEVEIS